MHEMVKFLIVGCGSIGALKDDKFDNPQSKNILTIAHAVHAHPEAEIFGLVDTDINKLAIAKAKWGVSKTDTTLKSFLRDRIDVVVIAVPTDKHYEVAKDVASFIKPAVTLMEKPCGMNYKEAQAICGLDGLGKIRVDYIRAFSHPINNIIFEINDKKYGEVRHIRLLYGRGFKHEACHAIEMIHRLAGRFNRALTDIETMDDGPHDSTLTFLAQHEYATVYYQGIDSRIMGIFELEVICDKAIIRFPDHGTKIEIREPMTEKVYGDCPTVPGFGKLTKDTGLTTALLNVVDDCCRLARGERSDSDMGIFRALNIHEDIENIEGLI